MAASLPLLTLQIGLLALTTGVLGLLCGRYVWPRQVSATPPAQAPERLSADLEPALSDLEERLQTSESEVAQLRRAVTQVTDDASGAAATD